MEFHLICFCSRTPNNREAQQQQRRQRAEADIDASATDQLDDAAGEEEEEKEAEEEEEFEEEDAEEEEEEEEDDDDDNEEEEEEEDTEAALPPFLELRSRSFERMRTGIICEKRRRHQRKQYRGLCSSRGVGHAGAEITPNRNSKDYFGRTATAPKSPRSSFACSFAPKTSNYLYESHENHRPSAVSCEAYRRLQT